MACNLESYAIAVNRCFGGRQPRAIFTLMTGLCTLQHTTFPRQIPLWLAGPMILKLLLTLWLGLDLHLCGCFLFQTHPGAFRFEELAVAAAGTIMIGFFPSTWHFPLLQVDLKMSWHAGHSFSPIAIHFGCSQTHFTLHFKNFFSFMEPWTQLMHVFFFDSLGQLFKLSWNQEFLLIGCSSPEVDR